jgi:uncharacterized protein (TIGR00730 family)
MKISVFGSSRPTPREAEYKLAYDLGASLARAEFVVCNGGYGGIMEASARGAKEAGGRTIGIVSSSFGGRIANKWIDEVVDAPSMVDRLLKLVEYGDGYAVLKGGTGTLLELAAVWEFMNKGIISGKPIVVVGEFWEGVVQTLKEVLSAEGLEPCTRYVTVVSTPGECVRFLQEKLKGRER